VITVAKGKSFIELVVNGRKVQAGTRPADTLLHILRNELGLFGAKPGCETGDCGSCTVLVDGWPIHSCIMLAADAIGHRITTIEALTNSPVQQAFVTHHALQCGYCTPGFVLNGHALLNIHPDASDEVIKEWMSSNLCRCTGYEEIQSSMNSLIRRGQGSKTGS
jgi:aerobic carbon-monoxide dehydrogenase small subunit